MKLKKEKIEENLFYNKLDRFSRENYKVDIEIMHTTTLHFTISFPDFITLDERKTIIAF